MCGSNVEANFQFFLHDMKGGLYDLVRPIHNSRAGDPIRFFCWALWLPGRGQEFT